MGLSRRVRGAVVASFLAVTLCAGRAAAQAPHCLSLPPVEDIAPADMPPILRGALAQDVGTYALPGPVHTKTIVRSATPSV